MKMTSFYLLFVVASSFYACTNDDMNTPVVANEQSEVTNEVSLNAAKDLLTDFVGETNARSESSFKIKSHQVRTVYVNSGEALGRAAQEAIPVYEFVTETNGKEGYSVVVGDKRVEKVLISVPQGSIADTAHIKPLKWYFEDIPLLIEQDLKQYYEGTKETTVQSRMTAETIYKFTSTSWGQYEPYNAQCPNQYPAGCVAIAVAQILAYHQVPSNLNWSAILRYSTVNEASGSVAIDQVSTLVHNIGVSLNTQYGITVSTATLQNISSVLSYYGLRCGGVFGFSINDAKNSLQSGGPFIMSAMPASGTIGHTWVCDGWKRHIYEDNSYYDYLNMNWGYNGNSNGFFSIENPMSFNVAGSLYNRDFKLVYNVRKQ